MKPTIANVLLAAALGLCAQGAMAQSFSIEWYTIDASGGACTGDGFSLSGTLGEADANPQPMTNGRFSLAGGFWSVFALSTPDAPLISIEVQGAKLRVFWPMPATGYVLDQSLTVTGAWSQVSFPYLTNATDISISVPVPTGNNYYRLRRL